MEQMLIRTFALKKLKKTKVFTHREIMDRIPEKVVSVITKVYAEPKLWILRKLRWPDF